MTNKQYRTRKLTVGTVQKSIATMASRWFRRKPSQRFSGSPRRWTARRYRDTDRSESTKPSFSSSPWILGAPQVGFSRAILRISAWQEVTASMIELLATVAITASSLLLSGLPRERVESWARQAGLLIEGP